MWLMLKLQYFGHLIWTTNSLEKTLCWERLKAEGEEGDRGWDCWLASLIQWTWTWGNFGSLGGIPIGEGLSPFGGWWGAGLGGESSWVAQGSLVCCSPSGLKEIQLGDWATATKRPSVLYFSERYSECITHLSWEVVVNSCRFEIQYLLIIDIFPTVRVLFRNIFIWEIWWWFLVLLIHKAVWAVMLLLFLHCPPGIHTAFGISGVCL